ncbi:MAG: DegT/DnrJ/EryC1/StrS family aminotransferase [Chloroflexales bacterium]|nr:DegT/DnrJ/EryC1/StrS family aminotransferase [Chloroflexales bacterium]
MIPRGVPDIGWNDLLYGLLSCVWPADACQAQAQAEAAWSSSVDSLACLSVRSGFDLVLQALDLSPGSEVLVSAITIRDMVAILEHHQLVPIPIDIDMQTLTVDQTSLLRAITPQTKAILIAHLFGSRMPMEPIVQVARQHGLHLIEDCAQAYAGEAYRGHPASDVCMFSFGPIKTHTTLGGAILRFKSHEMLDKVRTITARYPRQPVSVFLRRLGLFALLKLLAHPLPLQIFFALCRWRGIDHDQALYRALRGFAGGEIMRRIRQQPCRPLLQLLRRRLQQSPKTTITKRCAYAQQINAYLPLTSRLGAHAKQHTHWVLPIQTHDPTRLLQMLQHAGFDATQRASSLYVVPPSPQHSAQIPLQAVRAMAQVVYLPLYLSLSERDIRHLGEIITAFESRCFVEVDMR